MVWTRNGTDFYRSRPAMNLSHGALWLHQIMLDWSGGQLTDGFVPSDMIVPLSALARTRPKHVKELLEDGLLSEENGGVIVTDWISHSLEKEAVLAKRAKDAAKKKNGREQGKRDLDEMAEGGNVPEGLPEGVPSPRSGPVRSGPVRYW